MNDEKWKEDPSVTLKKVHSQYSEVVDYFCPLHNKS